MNPAEYTYYILGSTVWRFPEGSDSGEVTAEGLGYWMRSQTSHDIDFKNEHAEPAAEWEVELLLGGEI